MTSEEALQNPFNSKMTLDKQLINIPLLNNAITETSFTKKDRLGRLVAFMGVIAEVNLRKTGVIRAVHGIGIEEGAALLIDGATAVGRMVGRGNVYLLSGLKPEVCQAGEPLTYRALLGYQMDANSLFNFRSWTGLNGRGFRMLVEEGELSY